MKLLCLKAGLLSTPFSTFFQPFPKGFPVRHDLSNIPFRFARIKLRQIRRAVLRVVAMVAEYLNVLQIIRATSAAGLNVVVLNVKRRAASRTAMVVCLEDGSEFVGSGFGHAGHRVNLSKQ